MSPHAAHAFLSHSSADNILAKRIYRTLRDQAASVWFDRIEIRPGDSLLRTIADGIERADVLLVLVTPDSNRSPWVQKEVSLAASRQMDGRPLRVIPLVLDGCQRPTSICDLVYVPIDKDGLGLDALASVVFPDSYILDFPLGPSDLACDRRTLLFELNEAMRSDRPDVRVRIDHRGFADKVDEIAEKTVVECGGHPGVVDQIRRTGAMLPLILPIFWVNLSEVLSQVVNAAFRDVGRNLHGVELAGTSLLHTYRVAERMLARRLAPAVFPEYAARFGRPEIAAFMERNAELPNWFDEPFVRRVCDIRDDQHVVDVDLVGRREDRVRDSKCQIPILGDGDLLNLQHGVPPDLVIMPFTWFTVALPQVAAHFLAETLTSGKPAASLDYRLGASLGDYTRIGLA